jgi:hypothetical protein
MCWFPLSAIHAKWGFVLFSEQLVLYAKRTGFAAQRERSVFCCQGELAQATCARRAVLSSVLLLPFDTPSLLRLF